MMKKRLILQMTIVFSLFGMVIGFQNCSKQDFDTIDPIRKQQVLEDTAVFGEEVAAESVDVDVVGQVGDDNDDKDTVDIDIDGEVEEEEQEIVVEFEGEASEQIDVTRLCSDMYSRDGSGKVSVLNAVTSDTMKVTLTDVEDPSKILCEITDRNTLLKDLSNPDGGFVDVSSCNLKKDQAFHLELVVGNGGKRDKDLFKSDSKTSPVYVYNGHNIRPSLTDKAAKKAKDKHIAQIKKLRKSVESQEKKVAKKATENNTAKLDKLKSQLKTLETTDYRDLMKPKSMLFDINGDKLKREGETERAALCEKNYSPLAIDMSPSQAGLKLTSPVDGVKFDIQGARAQPKAFTKKQISWVRSADYMFLTLPTEKGLVHGIDQLFGDNTRGPKGKFSPDGFAALAKYDGMSISGKDRIAEKDGYINRLDPIYSKLRLWSDKNLDGVASPDELKSLEEMSIVTIDLKYDAKYRERDIYGNIIKYKSAVKIKNQDKDELRLMFDIWFRVGNE